jgi:glycosyltransferase involved in cell wall biosynthesis
MDGGSADETVEILKQYGNKIKWVSEKDEGQADAVNKGIQMATGDIIGWLNSDDTYLPGAIQTAVEFLTTHKEVSMMYGEGYHVEENGVIMERYPTEPFDYQRLAQTCFICQPTAFFRKDIFNQVGLLRKDLHLCMDYELWMRIGKNHTIAYIPHFMATSRMYQDNKTLSRRKEVFIEIIKTVKLYYGYAPVSWVYGYADYLRSGSRNSLFYFTLIYLLVQYNFSQPRFLRNEIKTILKEKLKPIMKRKQFTDQYSDGWVDKVYKRSVTVRSQQRIVIKGKHLWPFSNPLKLVISLNNKKMMEFYQKEHGEFVVVAPVPTSFTGVAELKITANKTFNPKKLNINEDNRELAFILHEIEIS